MMEYFMMVKKRKSLKHPRSSAFSVQNGFCFYCRQPMWSDDPSELSSEYNISRAQANILRCTGEHLVAYKDDGSSGKENIVAACWYCNQRRHRRKSNPSIKQYKIMIQRRLKQGRWHGLCLSVSDSSLNSL
jgi:hypothetical protein